MNKSLIFISSHSCARSGAHRRFDRLASEISKNHKNSYWVTPNRELKCSEFYGITYYGPDVLKKLPLTISATLRTILFLLSDRKPRKKGIAIAFGETHLGALVATKLITRHKTSLGIRSNTLVREKHDIADSRPLARPWLKFKRLAKYLIRRILFITIDQFVVQTQASKETFSKDYGIRKSKIDVVENDLPKTFSKHSQGSNDKSKIDILFVGAARSVKGFDVLERLISTAPKNIKKITLAGYGEKGCIKVRKLKENSVIPITGIPWTKEPQKLMENHDILIVPSREDQFPNIVLEGMAVGIPVLGSARDGILHMLKDERLLFNPENPESLLSRINWISSLQGYAEAKKLIGERAQAFKFDWSNAYLQVLEERFQC